MADEILKKSVRREALILAQFGGDDAIQSADHSPEVGDLVGALVAKYEGGSRGERRDAAGVQGKMAFDELFKAERDEAVAPTNDFIDHERARQEIADSGGRPASRDDSERDRNHDCQRHGDQVRRAEEFEIWHPVFASSV